MSMICNLARITEAQYASLSAGPSIITKLIYGDVDDQPVAPKRGLLSRLFSREPVPPTKTESQTVPPIDPTDQVDLDKAWHTLHFLFTGDAWGGLFPEGFLVSCGKPVGSVDVGYGPARMFDPKEVQAIAAFVESQQADTMRKKLNPKKLLEEQIYPNFGSESAVTDEDWAYIAGAFESASAFIRETNRRGMAMLVYLN